MPALSTICEFLQKLAPLELAESWDNVGLLVGDPQRQIARVMTCLTVTPASADEAVAGRADLVITHHPLPFKPLSRLTTETTPGKLLLKLIGKTLWVRAEEIGGARMLNYRITASR